MRNDEVFVDLIVGLIRAVDLKREYARVGVVSVAHGPIDSNRFAWINGIVDGQMLDGAVEPVKFRHYIFIPGKIAFLCIVGRLSEFAFFGIGFAIFLFSGC